jgi:hypothetical protein
LRPKLKASKVCVFSTTTKTNNNIFRVGKNDTVRKNHRVPPLTPKEIEEGGVQKVVENEATGQVYKVCLPGELSACGLCGTVSD